MGLMNFLPQTLLELQASIASIATMFIGLLYFAAPKTMLGFIGIAPDEKHPEAFGEGRSTFAGFLILLGALCFFIKEPLLMFILFMAWIFVAAGKIVQIVVDGARKSTVFLRFALAIFLASVSFSAAVIPDFRFNFDFALANTAPSVSAFITLMIGLLFFLMPSFAAALMRLNSNNTILGSIGEIRGNAAGFYIALAVAVLFIGGTHAILALGLCWLMTAFGRMISMLSDGTNNFYNWISLLVEFTLAALPLLVAFGLL